MSKYSEVAVRSAMKLWCLKSIGIGDTKLVQASIDFLRGNYASEREIEALMQWYRLQPDDEMKLRCAGLIK